MADISDVYFVDGMRTPFGRAGEKGMYWNTRADDLVVKTIIGIMERNPGVPGERIDDVAIAATSGPRISRSPSGATAVSTSTSSSWAAPGATTTGRRRSAARW